MPSGDTPSPSELVPGAIVGGGRYRLLAPHGGTEGFQFWHATDTTLRREVALTIVAPDSETAATLERTLRLRRIDSPGLARVLDVFDGSDGRIIVAEWTPGRSLREIVEIGPTPSESGRGVRALAAAAETAHRGQSVLAIDHPDRIRFDTAGRAVLAFPAVHAGADIKGDIRGLGAVLYALLTGGWALGGPNDAAGLPLAQRNSDSSPIAPHTLRPEVSYPMSVLAVRALDTGADGVRTAGTVVNVLDQTLAQESKQSAASVAPHVVASGSVVDGSTRGRGPILAGFGAAGVVLALLIWWTVSSVAGGVTDSPVPNVGPASTQPSSASEIASTPPSPVDTSPPVPVPAQLPPPAAPEQPAPQSLPEQAPAPAPPPPAPPEQAPPAPAGPQEVPCYPGYFHDPAHGGQCWA